MYNSIINKYNCTNSDINAINLLFTHFFSLFTIIAKNVKWVVLNNYLNSLVLHLTDVDECLSGTHGCATTAKCSNSDGSFSCACNTGYSGDGVTCTGKIIIIMFSD